MLNKVFRGLASLIAAMVLIVLGSVPVKAANEQPTTASLNNIAVFRNLVDTGDFLAVVPYTLEFTTAPTIPITETYLFTMLSADGSTMLGTTLAPAQYDLGYGQGVVSFYYSAASNMTWGEEYIFRIQQNPAYYPTPQKWDFTINASNYSSYWLSWLSPGASQASALKAKIISLAQALTPVFGVSLLSRSESGQTVLSPSSGEVYFLEAIPGIQWMASSLFGVELISPSYAKRSWSTSFADALRTKYAGTFVYDFMTGYAGLFNIEVSTGGNVFSFFMALTLIIVSILKFKATLLSALLDGYVMLLLFMQMGFFSMIWAGFIAFVSAVVGGAIIFFKRA